MSALLLDEDDYVTIGTPFEIPDDDEPLPKPSKVEDQIVTDKQGRRRLHGAFTGGFSAGYFNTVGSKEGWAPSSFKSSRSKKNNEDDEDTGSRPSKPEDFMDEEDFSEYGIAPKKLKTSSSYSRKDTDLESKKQDFLKAVDKGQVHSAIPGGIPLDDLVGTRDYSIGIKLLKKLGWKPGQGVGEKVELSEEVAELLPKKKVYGCAMPPKSKVETVDAQAFVAMLAPKDMQPVNFERKDNLHGIGYYALLAHPSSCPPGVERNTTKELRPNKSKRGIRGHAFGIGVFEDDEEYDVYGDSEFSHHDMTMCNDDDPKDGWTGTTAKPAVHKDTLTGFVKSLKKLHIAAAATKIPIDIPKEVPRHVFSEDVDKKKDGEGSARSKLSSHERSELLGEAVKTMEDVKHWSLKWDKKEGSIDTSSEASASKKAINDKNSKTILPANPAQQDTAKSKSVTVPNEQHDVDIKTKTSIKTPVVFQPFAKDPEKQSRYNDFLTNRKSTNNFKDASSGMTEWEKAQEIAEFARAAVLYQPLRSAMADRFVSANTTTAPETKTDGDTSSDMKAAEMGMFGKMTRTTLEWHPDPVLCKRMNIPNPFPHSSLKGVPTRSNKHTSIFSDDFVGSMVALAGSGTRHNLPSNPSGEEAVGDAEDVKLPMETKRTEEEDMDEEFVARMQRNKGKLLRGKVGPLSHLNIKIEDANGSESAGSVSTTTSSTPSATIIATGESKPDKPARPAMDIFKAVFENSDSDSSDEDEDEMKEGVKNEGVHAANDSVPTSFAASICNNRTVGNVSTPILMAESACAAEVIPSATRTLEDKKGDGLNTGLAIQVNARGIQQEQPLQQKQQQQQKYNKDLSQKLPLSFLNKPVESSNMCTYGSKTKAKTEDRKLPLSFLNKNIENDIMCSSGPKTPIKTEERKLPLSFLNKKTESSSMCTYGPKVITETEDREGAARRPEVKQSCNSTSKKDNDDHRCYNSSRDQRLDHESDEHRKTKSKKRKKEKKTKKSKKHKHKRDNDTDSDENYREKTKCRTDGKSRKKKKRKHSNRHSSSSASSSSSDDEDSNTPSNAVLLEKLKKFVPPKTETTTISRSSSLTAMSSAPRTIGSRPTAADFM